MSNLDDFFKKRDKKKKSAKSKFPTLDTDELAKNLEATAIKGDEEIDFQDNNNNLTTTTTTTAATVAVSDSNLDEEWKPYEDENKDLSGLKITFLKQVEDENNDYLGVIDENEKKSACPWGSVCTTAQNKTDDNNQPDNDASNEPVKQTALSDSTNQLTNADIQKTSSSSQIAATESNTSKPDYSAAAATSASTASAYVPPALRRQQPAADTKPAVTAPTETTSSKYVPPSMRGRGTDSSSNNTSNASAIPTTSVNYRRPNKSQPNINDTMEFPTLDAAGTESANTSDKMTNVGGEKFEMAKKGARIEPKSEGNMINLANKFTALSSNN